MKRIPWEWAVGIGVAFAAHLILAPPSVGTIQEFPEMPESEREVYRLWMSRADSARSLRQLLGEAEALERGHRLVARGGSAIFSADAGIPAFTVARYRDPVGRALERYPDADASRVRVHVSLSTDPNAGFETTFLLPATPDEPCLVLMEIDARYLDRIAPGPRDDLLGPCGFFARYGAPGAGMRDWLEHTRAASAFTEVETSLISGTRTRRPPPTTFSSSTGTRSGCLAGTLALCERYFTGGAQWRGALAPQWLARVTRPSRVVWRSFGESRMNLARLRTRIGDEAFLQVWRSDAEPSVAVRRAAGQDLGTLVRDMLLDAYPVYRPGPWPATVPLVLGLVLAVAAAIAAVRLAPRRQT